EGGRGGAAAVWGLMAGGAAPPRPATFPDAHSALERARTSTSASYSVAAFHEAEAALAAAEREEKKAPGSESAQEAAYIAERKADLARISGMYAADLEALEAARKKSSRLREAIERLREMRADRARAAAELRARRVEQRAARDRALVSAIADDGTVLRDGGRIVLRMPSNAIFIPGYPLLRQASPERVETIAAAIRVGPPSRVVIDVAETAGVDGMGPTLL